MATKRSGGSTSMSLSGLAAVRPARGSRVAAKRDAERPVMLITAGPTHEPIDAVRFIGNRSSGKLGAAVAAAAAEAGWRVLLLLGPVKIEPPKHRLIATHRFMTTADLEKLLGKHQADADALIMAAAVADFRPGAVAKGGKLRRTAKGLTLKLEPTPDLLAGCAKARARKHLQQVLVGFALEKREELEASAKGKLVRKGVDAVVANELETMEADTIRAKVFIADGSTEAPKGRLSKVEFAHWLVELTEALVVERALSASPCGCGEAH